MQGVDRCMRALAMLGVCAVRFQALRSGKGNLEDDFCEPLLCTCMCVLVCVFVRVERE